MANHKIAKGIKKIEHRYKMITTEDYLKDFVDVDKFIEYCKSCPNYGARWSCPPYSYDIMEYYWKKYKYLHLFAFKMYLDDSVAETDMTEEQINDLVMSIRHQNYILVSEWIKNVEKTNPDSTAVDGGHCAKCKRCMRLDNKPCRYGNEYRPGIDAIGGNLVKTAEDIFGIKILWIKNGVVPDYFLFMVGLLSDDEKIKFKF